MTTNERQLEMLSAFMDEQLGDSDRRAVEAWLRDDPELRRIHRQWAAVSDGLKQLPAPLVSLDFQDRVMQQATAPVAAPHGNQTESFRMPTTAVPWLVAALTVAAAALIAVSLSHSGHHDPSLVAQTPETPIPDSTAPGFPIQPTPGLKFVFVYEIVLNKAQHQSGLIQRTLKTAGLTIANSIQADPELEDAILKNRLLGSGLRNAAPGAIEAPPTSDVQLLYIESKGRPIDQVIASWERMTGRELVSVRPNMAIVSQDDPLFQTLGEVNRAMLAESGTPRGLGVARRVLVSVALRTTLARQLETVARAAAPAASAMLTPDAHPEPRDDSLDGLADSLNAMEDEDCQMIVVVRVVPNDAPSK